MAARVVKDTWSPPAGSLPIRLELGTVYLIPTRAPGEGEDLPMYTDSVRYLPKKARAEGLPVEFSMPEASRRYVQEFSALETWALGVAVLSMANDWLIHTVQQYIEMRRAFQGWTREESNALPLKVSVAHLDEKAETLATYDIEGGGDDVLEALRILKGVEPQERNVESG